MSRNGALATELICGKKHRVIPARCKMLRKVHGTENSEMGWWWMCKCIDVLLMGEEINEEGDIIGEVHGEIRLLEKDKIVSDVNKKKLGLMKNDMSQSVLKRL